MPQRMPSLPLTSLETESNRVNPIDVLRRLVGATPVDPRDPGGAFYGDSTGSLALAQGRGMRQTELENRVANDQFGLKPDPNTGRDVALLKFLKGEQAADPYTGTAATARTHQVQDELDDVASFNRPEQTGMRREILADKERLASAPSRMTGEYNLKRQALENAGFRERQELENTGALERQHVASQGVVDAARSKSGGTGKMAPSVMMKFAEVENVVAGLKKLRELKPKVSTGPAAGRMQSFLQKVPLIESDPTFAEFDAEGAGVGNSLAHAISGAAVTPQERVRLNEQIPLSTDKDGVWEVKATALERSMRGYNRRLALLNQGVPAAVVMKMSLEELADMPEGTDSDSDQDPIVVDDGFVVR